MGKLNYLIIHCTATPKDRHIDKDDIIRWHMSPVSKGGRGWSRVGYSDMIYLDGQLVNLTPFNQDNRIDGKEMTWGVRGQNSRSRHMVYVGGIDDFFLDDEDITGAPDACDTRTPEQLETMEVYVKYMIKRHPQIKVAGHNQFSIKSCPSFVVPDWLRSIGVAEKNIYKNGK